MQLFYYGIMKLNFYSNPIRTSTLFGFIVKVHGDSVPFLGEFWTQLGTNENV